MIAFKIILCNFATVFNIIYNFEHHSQGSTTWFSEKKMYHIYGFIFVFLYLCMTNYKYGFYLYTDADHGVKAEIQCAKIHSFYGYEKALHRVNIIKLWKIMARRGIPQHLIQGQKLHLWKLIASMQQ